MIEVQTNSTADVTEAKLNLKVRAFLRKMLLIILGPVTVM